LWRGRAASRVQGPAVAGIRVQQGPLPGQPQVQLRVELRHTLMLSRIPAHSGIRTGVRLT
jgi:hypothetical protein